jgi:ELWxxDGT repeat protein
LGNVRRLAAIATALGLGLLALAVPARAGASPTLVEDINPGGSADPTELTNVGGILYFAAAGADGRELYRSDGTEEGTYRLRDINAGPAGSAPRHLTDVSGRLFFSANDGIRGRELWTSDGTEIGTKRVKDIRPGARGSTPSGIVRYDGKALFAANDGTHGIELWRSDGTKAGTRLVKDINLDQGSGPTQLTTAKGLLFFVADAVGGPEMHGFPFLWRSDGTRAGTRGMSSPLLPQDLTRAGGLLYWYSIPTKDPDEALWRTDGTDPGTKRLMGLQASDLASLGATLLFAGFDDEHGSELWRSNGTTAGTRLVKDLWPGGTEDGPYSSAPHEITRVGPRAFLAAYHGQLSGELWITNGYGGGTTKLADVCATRLTGAGGSLYFSGGTFDSDFGCIDGELWTSDGTVPGTLPLPDINPTGGSSPRELTDVAGTLYFTAEDGTSGRELWMYAP